MFPPWTTPEAAAEILKNGGVVAIPTETVYGLAGNAYDPKALAKIFEAKKRPHFDPLIVHISAIEELSNVALEVPEVAKKLAKAYWPGPMTLVLPKKDCIPDLATSGLPTVAVRFPNHPIAQKIIRLAGVPLAAPSANLFIPLFLSFTPFYSFFKQNMPSQKRRHIKRVEQKLIFFPRGQLPSLLSDGKEVKCTIFRQVPQACR